MLSTAQGVEDRHAHLSGRQRLSGLFPHPQSSAGWPTLVRAAVTQVCSMPSMLMGVEGRRVHHFGRPRPDVISIPHRLSPMEWSILAQISCMRSTLRDAEKVYVRLSGRAPVLSLISTLEVQR